MYWPVVSDIWSDLQGGWTALMLATKNGHEEIVRFVTDHGCNIHHQDKVIIANNTCFTLLG